MLPFDRNYYDVETLKKGFEGFWMRKASAGPCAYDAFLSQCRPAAPRLP